MPSLTHCKPGIPVKWTHKAFRRSGSTQDVQQCVCPSHHATEVNGLIGRAHMPAGVQVNGGLCSLLMSPNFVCRMTDGDCCFHVCWIQITQLSSLSHIQLLVPEFVSITEETGVVLVYNIEKTVVDDPQSSMLFIPIPQNINWTERCDKNAGICIC
ncbi:hypothetical protein AVEN_152366-1 [Araneus ventricosus]|uniref:Uncharacterized protein n=1 Tax=Araneus ventricosus TaxID=182803 RepID=A0A4Y2DAX4_ARAVE|nr:hypothetical protein AVEN_152366-1 [Araneus ventricosus]